MNSIELSEDDPRIEFMGIYNDLLEDAVDKVDDDLTVAEERSLRVGAMVETCIEVRKELDSELVEMLKDLETLKDLKQYLMAEYRPFGAAGGEKAARLFAEYLLFSLLEQNDIKSRINMEFLADGLNEGLAKMPAEARESLLEARDVFEWGPLVNLD